MRDTDLITFDCPVELLEELDTLAAKNLLHRTDVIVFASANLLEFMEGNKCTSKSPQMSYDEDISADIEAMITPEQAPRDPHANVVPSFDEGEDDGIVLLKPRR